MPVSAIVQLLVAAGPTIVQGVEELISALKSGTVSHEDVLAALAQAKQQQADAIAAARAAAADADAAALAEEALPPDGILK